MAFTVPIQYDLYQTFLPQIQILSSLEEYSDFPNYQRNIMRTFSIHLDWKSLLLSNRLSETFLIDYHDKFDINQVVVYQKVSENFVEKFLHKLSWGIISRRLRSVSYTHLVLGLLK